MNSRIIRIKAEKSGKSSSGGGGGPTPRFGASMAVAKSGQLFLFGGMVEDGDKQITLNDFYCLGEEPSLELAWDFVFIIIQGDPTGCRTGNGGKVSNS